MLRQPFAGYETDRPWAGLYCTAAVAGADGERGRRVREGREMESMGRRVERWRGMRDGARVSGKWRERG